MFFILDIFFLTENLEQNLLQAKYATMYTKTSILYVFLSLHDVLLISKIVYFTQTIIHTLYYISMIYKWRRWNQPYSTYISHAGLALPATQQTRNSILS